MSFTIEDVVNARTDKFTNEDVVNACADKYGLIITKENRSFYSGFVHRHKSQHKYDISTTISNINRGGYVYFDLMIDKLLMFAYLTGQMPITVGFEGNTQEIFIESEADLYALKWKEVGLLNRKRRTDDRLLRLYITLNSRNNRYGNLGNKFSLNWSDLIIEVGRDLEVVRYLGKNITYEMVSKCFSPYKEGSNGKGEPPSVDEVDEAAKRGKEISDMMTQIHPTDYFGYRIGYPKMYDSSRLIIPILSEGVDMEQCLVIFKEEFSGYVRRLNENIQKHINIAFGLNGNYIIIENTAENDIGNSKTDMFLTAIQLLFVAKKSELKLNTRH